MSVIIIWDVLLDVCWPSHVGFVPGAFPCVRLRCCFSQQECQTAQRLDANAFSMEKEHLLKSVKPFSDQVPHLFISVWFWFAFCPSYPQLFFVVFEMRTLLHALMRGKEEKKKRMSTKKLSVSPLLAVKESDEQIVIEKYPIVVEKPSFWHLC